LFPSLCIRDNHGTVLETYLLASTQQFMVAFNDVFKSCVLCMHFYVYRVSGLGVEDDTEINWDELAKGWKRYFLSPSSYGFQTVHSY